MLSLNKEFRFKYCLIQNVIDVLIIIIKSDHHISKAIYLNQSSCILNKFKNKNIKTKLNNTKNINQKKKKRLNFAWYLSSNQKHIYLCYFKTKGRSLKEVVFWNQTGTSVTKTKWSYNNIPHLVVLKRNQPPILLFPSFFFFFFWVLKSSICSLKSKKLFYLTEN